VAYHPWIKEMTYLIAFFGPLAVGLVVFGVAVRGGRRIWPVWLIGTLALLVFALPESSLMGIPWDRVMSGKLVPSEETGQIELAILGLVILTVLHLVGWSLAALLGDLFKPNTVS
jgi:hypothetical protein